MKKTLFSILFVLFFGAYAAFQRASSPTAVATNTPQTAAVTQEPVVAPVQTPSVVAGSGPNPGLVPSGGDMSYQNEGESEVGSDDGGGSRRVNRVAQNPTQTAPAPQTSVPAPTPAPAQPKPQPQQPVAPAPAPAQPANQIYKDGTFTGPSVDAYYGNVQVSVTTKGDRIVDVQFLDYPHDRNTSIRINSYAMPQLRSEAIQIQGSQVDTVSGASATSGGFRDSLSAALALAHV